jgi:TIR domain
MTAPEAAAFWSYAHEDNRLDGGSIVGLAEHLAAEFSLVTGRPLRLFVDRDIAWGDEWRARIDVALTEATFFIPILTPRYFSRTECRKELTEFHRQAESRGLGELLLPILYAVVPDYADSNPDELIALASRYQYVGWTDLRLEEPSSTAYRRAVNGLAQRLADVQRQLAEKQLSRELADVPPSDVDAGAPGLFELLEEMQPLLSKFREAIESNHVAKAQHNATWELLGPRLLKSEQVAGQGGQRFALLQRIAREDLPLAQRNAEYAREYVRLVLQLDPLMTHMFRHLREHADDAPVFVDAWDALKAVEAEVALDGKTSTPGVVPAPAAAFFAERAHVSKLVRQVASALTFSNATIEEGHVVARRWLREREDVLRLTGGAAGGARPEDAGPS